MRKPNIYDQLRQKKTGRMFSYTAVLEKRDDMDVVFTEKEEPPKVETPIQEVKKTKLNKKPITINSRPSSWIGLRLRNKKSGKSFEVMGIEQMMVTLKPESGDSVLINYHQIRKDCEVITDDSE